jgi:hypothetical protein
VLFGPDIAMRYDTTDESDDDGDGSKENTSFLEFFSPVGNIAAAVGCQPRIQW